jgi:hypothetical protein
MSKQDNNNSKNAKKASNDSKKARHQSFVNFVKNTSGGIYKYDKRRNLIRIKDGLVWRDAKEDGILSRFVIAYHKAYVV